jgi:hypothetical protein
MAMADKMGFDINTVGTQFVPGNKLRISTVLQRVREEVDALGGVDLIVIDTSSAYFEGDEENDNKQMGDHARMLRSLVNLPGDPCVVVACHPAKAASTDNLLPRGGYAFLCEMDGNLVSVKRDNIAEVHWHGKFRGPEFEPFAFELGTITSDALVSKKGRQIYTVMATPLGEEGKDTIRAAAREDEDLVLESLAATPGISLRKIAEDRGWIFQSTGEPAKSRVQKIVDKLKKAGLVEFDRDTWTVTKKGETAIKKAAKSTSEKQASGW